LFTVGKGLTIRLTIVKRTRSAGHVARRRKKRNACKVLFGNIERRRRRHVRGERITLKWILRKLVARA
jgi:hypothetical protein